MWRRHDSTSHPSRRALRATCMQLLPLVEMFCKWELQEDCSDLRALMLRFDSEAALGTHDLGRSLLEMLRNDDTGLHVLPTPTHFPSPLNPFDEFRSCLAVVDTAIQALQPQVHIALVYNSSCSIPALAAMPLYRTSTLCSHCTVHHLNKCEFMVSIVVDSSASVGYCGLFAVRVWAYMLLAYVVPLFSCFCKSELPTSSRNILCVHGGGFW